MRAERIQLAKIESPYALAVNGTAEAPVFYAASEARNGKALMFSGNDLRPTLLAERPGGCMGIVPLGAAGLPGLLLVEDFFPVFQCEGSGAAVYLPPDAGGGPWARRRVFDLPFLHRVVLLKPWNRPVLLAAQLCRSKDGIDDWRSPGAVYAAHPAAFPQPWRLEGKPVLDGLRRNHGLFVSPESDRGEIFVAADEGIFRIWKPASDQPWATEPILDLATSDLWMHDLDGDGEPEMAAIHPFHGDSARVFKRVGGRWEQVWETAGEFGHVVWAGELLGRPGVLLGWRKGARSLDFHILEDSRAWSFRKVTLDSDAAPLNVRVIPGPGGERILATLEATGEIVLYSLLPDE